MSVTGVKNILVTGANGQLGTSLAIISSPSYANFFFTDIEQLDITSKRAVDTFIKEKKIDLVINCAAYTNVSAAENEKSRAREINAVAPKILANACKRNNAFLIHISTDYIFSGRHRTPISERAKPSPLNVYGTTKLEGERAIIESGCNSLIIRTSWLYSEYGNNFLKSMIKLLTTKDEIKVVDDQIGTPTYAGDLATAVYKISLSILYSKDSDSLSLEKNGTTMIYNYSNIGECSWYDFAMKIKKSIGSKCRIIPCTTSEYPSNVLRPKYSVLSKEKIIADFGIKIPKWESSVEKCIKYLSL